MSAQSYLKRVTKFNQIVPSKINFELLFLFVFAAFSFPCLAWPHSHVWISLVALCQPVTWHPCSSPVWCLWFDFWTNAHVNCEHFFLRTERTDSRWQLNTLQCGTVNLQAVCALQCTAQELSSSNWCTSFLVLPELVWALCNNSSASMSVHISPAKAKSVVDMTRKLTYYILDWYILWHLFNSLLMLPHLCSNSSEIYWM